MRSRRAKPWAPEPSLFPFLSVLVCMLGALMFLALGVAPTSLVQAASNVVLRFEGFELDSECEPIFFRCVEDSLVSIDRRYAFNIGDFEDKPWNGTAFGRFITSYADTAAMHIVFVVRPGGLWSFKVGRFSVVMYNREHCLTRITTLESPDESVWNALPFDLRSRLTYTEKEITLFEPMTPAERDLLKDAYNTAHARSAIDRLYERSQSLEHGIDHGSELVPTQWKVEDVTGGRPQNL